MKGIEFKGKAMEYFGIWLANILLTVVTIGIFSAWAKVRRLRYFYNRNPYNSKKITLRKLKEIGLKIGSDVPACMVGKSLKLSSRYSLAACL